MPKIDFKKITSPLPFIRKLMEGRSAQEIQDAQENFSEFLNTLQVIHTRTIASKKNYDKVEDR